VYFADRMIRPTATAAIVTALLCGAAAAPAHSGAVHEVRMLLTPDGRNVFDPATLTIRPGDRVRWINLSGGPHNVAFYADSIPAGAQVVLNAAMSERLGAQDLVGKLLFDEGEAYEISFAGAPEGRYRYFCTPHEMLGMNAVLTVAR
jgi:plastocyanin